MSHFERNGVIVTGDVHTGEIVVPYGNLSLWSTDELAAIGVTLVEDPPPSPPVIDDAVVRYECKRRIYAVASEAAQANMNGYINLLNLKMNAGQALTTQEQADVALFQQAMAWINDMRGAIAGLIGNAAYADDANWPALSADLQTFAARF